MDGLNHTLSSPSVPICISSYTPQESMPPNPTNISLLMNLPPEILIQIVGECDVWTLTNLRQANTFFCRICTSRVLYNATKDGLGDKVGLLFYAALTKDKFLALRLLRSLETVEIDFTRGPGGFRGPPKFVFSRSTAEFKIKYIMKNSSTLLLSRRRGAQMYNALAWAAEYNLIPFMKFLFKRDPSCVNDIDNMGRTPLSVAIHKGQESWGETLLLEYGADPNAHEIPTLYHAIVREEISSDFLTMLISKGATPYLSARVRGKWWTPLHAAAVYRDETVVNMILDCGVGVDPLQGDRGRSSTPLHLAALREDGELIVRALVKAGADCSLKNEHGKDVFELLEESNNPGIVHLISEMYQSGQEPPDKRTYTHLAVQHGAMGVLYDCIMRQENLETEDGDGHRPLYTAISFGRVEAAALLLEAGVEQSYLMGKYGTSLLHFAATIPGLEFYRLLLNKGSRLPFSLDRNRQSAISIASWAEIRPKDPRKNAGWRLRDGEAEAKLMKLVSEKQRELMEEAIEVGKRLGTIWDLCSGYDGGDEDDELGGA